jgi:predicted membrane channel-forming protein YqfA (hemolysin III family)
MDNEKRVGAGGTPGGVGQFFIGLIMAGVGAYLLLSQVQVTTSWWHFWGVSSFGLTLLPLLLGVGILFFNGKSAAGWILAALGSAIILAGILMNMDIYFRQTSLYNTLVMLILLAGGLGLIARSLKAKES